MSQSHETILITGASGFIGNYVAESALRRGWEVRTLSRRDWLGRPAVAVENRFLGALPYTIPEAAFAGVGTLVHLANTTGAETDSVARAVNVEGTRRLLEFAHRHGVKKIVYISSQSAKKEAISAYGKTKLEAEEVVRAGPLAYTILRPGLVYGAGTWDLFSRMCGVVKKFPVIPVLGNGKSPIQPIHVEDLAEIIFRCVPAGAFDGGLFRVGQSDPIRLADFLQSIAATVLGRRKPVFRIPLKPVILMVGMFESVGLRLPVSTNNLKGLEVVETMETRDDLKALGYALRPLEDGLREVRASLDARRTAAREKAGGNECERGSIGVALLGAGRIGLMHAVTIERLRGMRLAALVDTNPRACKLLQGIGIKTPAFQSLDAARNSALVDAVLIATPPRTHFPLAKMVLASGLPALIEKPLSAGPESLREFEGLAQRDRLQVGYWAPCLPQFIEAVEKLKAGDFGSVRGFEGFSLQSLFPGAKRWEVNPDVSGGGALINLGGHMLSMIHAAFGVPRSIESRQRGITSARVEDSLVADLIYPDFRGRYHVSWCIRGFPQAEVRLVVHTDRGALLCTTNAAAFIERDGRLAWFRHQLDYDAGFNLSPDYIGGGITAELCQFQELVRRGAKPGVPIERAAEIEHLLFGIYAKSQTTEKFPPATANGKDNTTLDSAIVASASRPAKPAADTQWILDIRRVADEDVRASDRGGLCKDWNGIQLAAQALPGWIAHGIPTDRFTIIVPDFMNYARLINGGRTLDLLKLFGISSTVALGLGGVKNVLGDRGVNFWTVARTLLAADLAKIPRDFKGNILLNSFLFDLAVGVDRIAAVEAMLKSMRGRAPSARIGVQTNIPRDAANLLVYLKEPVDVIQFLTSPGALYPAQTIGALKSSERFARCRFGAEAGLLPAPVFADILESPRAWLHGADYLVVDALCDARLANARRETIRSAWTAAFPGAEMENFPL